MTFVIAEPLVGKFWVRSNDCILEMGNYRVIWISKIQLENQYNGGWVALC